MLRCAGWVSLACCADSLCVVVFDFTHMAKIRDVSAILDTADAFSFAAGVLLAVILVLNAAALIRRLRKGGAP